jgi:uncharacterized protein YndB with AHSA1/START domain
MTEPLATRQFVDDRVVLHFERRLAHPPAKVWRAVTEPSELAHWFPATVDLELRTGAPMRFSEVDPDIEESTGEVLEVDEPKVFAFRWAGDVLRFELIPDGDGCRLLFTHALSGGDLWGDERFAAQHAAGWDACLELLAARIADEPTEPGPTDDWFRRNEEYVEAFGLAEGEVVEDADGSVLRFERILIQSPEEAWAALTGPNGEPEVGDAPPAATTMPTVPAGPVTEVEPGRVLAYEWRNDGKPAGWVRWTVSGRKYACHLVLTHAIPPELAGVRAAMLADWQVQLERFVASLHDVDRPWPEDRVETLRERYDERMGFGALHGRTDGRSELRFERRLRHPVEKVWRAITEPDELAYWFPATVELDLTPGAKIRFDLVPMAQERHDIPDEDMTSYGEVTAVEPHRLFEYTWSGEILRWELEPTRDGCLLRFTTVFDDRADAVGDGAGWQVALEALDAVLDGHPADRSSLFDRADELAEPYARALG